ncbi:hypothetical protein HY00_05005 [Peptococcaceae bacterium SCADC1_2_3]|jgi:hypothetical protein|nr:hypothetical protein HY00_05005 [Peptococcaceae bacterium SCADC1_2_3]
MKLELQTGVDAQGNPVIRTKSFSRLKATAVDQNVFDVAQALAGLQEYGLNKVMRVDGSELVVA